MDHLCVVYLDDILIYTHSDLIEEHWRAVRAVLARLREAELYANLKKCTFAKKSVAFLGFIITTEGVCADPARVESITSWPQPTNIKELQSFLGFTNFYRRFVESYAKITRPLTDLLKKSAEFQWNLEAQAAFEKVKRCFSHAPLLRHFDQEQEIRIETDASTFAIAGIMS